MVIDTSILLAIYFNESYSQWASEQLNANKGLLRMSTANLTETLIRLQDKQSHLFEEIREQLYTSGIRFVDVTQQQAEIAAQARLIYPLNMGDCFAYALAKVESCPILTLDQDFQYVDCPVVLPNRLHEERTEYK